MDQIKGKPYSVELFSDPDKRRDWISIRRKRKENKRFKKCLCRNLRDSIKIS